MAWIDEMYLHEEREELKAIKEQKSKQLNQNNMTQKPIKWTLVECVRYDRIYFMLKKDGESVKAFNNYDQALDEFNQAVNFIETDTIIREVEV